MENHLTTHLRRALWFLALLLALATPVASAATVQLVIPTQPQDAGVDAVPPGHAPIRLIQGVLGRTVPWTPSESQQRELLEALGKGDGDVEIVAHHVGYRDARTRVPRSCFTSGAHDTPPLVLEPIVRYIVFDTSPRGAAIRFEGHAARFAGESGKPMRLDMSELARNADNYITTLNIHFDLPGFRTKRETIRTADLESLDRWPPEGPVQLTESTLGAGLYYWYRDHRATLIASAVVLSLAFGGLGSWLYRRWRRVQHELTQKATLDRMLAGADARDPFLGRILDRWRLVGKLGQGGMGAVYRAVPNDDLDENEAVAIKIFTEEVMEDEEFQKRFRREVKICKTLHHANIVNLIDWGERDGFTYIVMELLEGITLRKYLSAIKADHPQGLPLAVALELLDPMLAAVSYAHQQGVVHRDLKPDNVIVLRPSGVVKIVDFGIARGPEHTRVTGSNEVMGTIGYMAPERLRGVDEDPRSDQYSLGVIAFEILTGEKPFKTDDTSVMLAFQCSGEVRSVRELRPSVPAAIADTIMRMIAARPEDRFATLDETRAVLRAAAADAWCR